MYLLAVLRPFLDAMPALADSGYEGAGHDVDVPVKKPAGMKELDINNRTRNALLSSARCLGERGFALLAQRWQILQTVTASPGEIGLIAARQVRGVQVPQVILAHGCGLGEQVMQALPVRGMGGVLVPYVRDPVDQQGPRVVAWYYPQDQYVQVRALTEWHRHDLRDPGRLDLRGAVIGGRLDRLLLDAPEDPVIGDAGQQQPAVGVAQCSHAARWCRTSAPCTRSSATPRLPAVPGHGPVRSRRQTRRRRAKIERMSPAYHPARSVP